MSNRRVLPVRALVAAGVLLALVLAGVVSHYASRAPDGLNRVAEQRGFSDNAGSRSEGAPLAGYRTKGVQDGRLSGALAGVAGTVVVLVLAGGLTFALRRRTDAGTR